LQANGQIESISNVKQAEKSQTLRNKIQAISLKSILVSYYNYESHVIARENNPEKEQQIGIWFEKVEKGSSQFYFEDPITSTRIQA